MSLSLEQKLVDLQYYLLTHGKKVVLIGEDHEARSIDELYEKVGKTMKIITKPKEMRKDFNVYLEFPLSLVPGVLQSKVPEPVASTQINLIRFFSLIGFPLNYATFNRVECAGDSRCLYKNGDQQYAADIKELLTKTEIVVVVIGLGHIPILSKLLKDYKPFIFNTSTTEGIETAKREWPIMYEGFPMETPDFTTLYPTLIDDVNSVETGRQTIDVWFQKHTKPPKIDRATAETMSVKELKDQLSLRYIDSSRMVDKSEMIDALVSWVGGRKKNTTLKRKKKRKTIRKKVMTKRKKVYKNSL